MIKYQFKILCFLCFVFLYNSTLAQSDSLPKKSFNKLEERSEVKYRAIPLPSYDPSTKWGISLALIANYYSNKMDTISPPSMTGLMGFYTTNESWAIGLIQNYNFDEDNWRLSGRLIYMNINQELDLGPNGVADASRKMTIGKLNGRRRIFNRLYLGIGYNYRAVEYEGRDEESQASLESAGYNQRAENHGISYLLTFDSRDNIYYPYKGLYIEYSLGQNLDNPTNEVNDDFLENMVDLRYFKTLARSTDHVLAFHFFGRYLSGNPTNENYAFYGRSGVQVQRGYEMGNYVDKNMINLEAEYRRETPLLKRKLGFTAFLSGGKVYGDFYSFNDADWLPSVGLGFRYRFLNYERMNFRTDIAYGIDGIAIYFGVREAF